MSQMLFTAPGNLEFGLYVIKRRCLLVVWKSSYKLLDVIPSHILRIQDSNANFSFPCRIGSRSTCLASYQSIVVSELCSPDSFDLVVHRMALTWNSLHPSVRGSKL
jgi:hypothetical protein